MNHAAWDMDELFRVWTFCMYSKLCNFAKTIISNMKKKVLAIINPISGTGNKEKLPRLIENQLDHDAMDVSVAFTEHPGHAHDMALQAVASGAHCVIAIGGDGTVNEVASALRDTSTVLAIIPVGSGNGLARHLRLPMNTARALQVVNEWHYDAFDYCTVNDRPFFCTCGVGFDAQVSFRFAQEGTRGFITYVKTTLNEFFHYKAQTYHIDIDGQQMEEKAMVIAGCNAAQYGNNAFIAPRATMQDGLIDLTVLHRFNMAGAALLGARLFTRSIDRDRHISIYRGKHIVIERDHDDVMHIDGDPVMMPARLELVCHHHGIHVMLEPRNNVQL